MRKVLARLGGWSQVLPSNFPGYINGRTLLYIGSILSKNLNTWRVWLVIPSNHLHHIVHAHAPYSVGLWRSPSLRAKQPCSSPRWHENKFLNADIYIVRNESDKKTAREALHNWKSTYAVKHLRTVIEEAKPLEGQPLFVSRKEGEQKRNGYKNMIYCIITSWMRKKIIWIL